MVTQSSKPPRLVIYYSSETNLSIQQIAGLPYTDIILAFLVPTSASDLTLKGMGNWHSLPDLKGSIQTLQTAGKNVLISFGGARGISSDQYQAYAENVGGLVADLVDNWVKPYGLNGVDIDFEDTSAFETPSPYNGVDFLSSLTE